MSEDVVATCGRFCETDCVFFRSLWNKKCFEGHVFIFHEILIDVGILIVWVGGTLAFIVDCTLGVMRVLFHDWLLICYSSSITLHSSLRFLLSCNMWLIHRTLILVSFFFICVHLCVCVCVHACLRTCTHMHQHACMCPCVCMHTCTCMLVCIS